HRGLPGASGWADLGEEGRRGLVDSQGRIRRERGCAGRGPPRIRRGSGPGSARRVRPAPRSREAQERKDRLRVGDGGRCRPGRSAQQPVHDGLAAVFGKARAIPRSRPRRLVLARRGAPADQRRTGALAHRAGSAPARVSGGSSEPGSCNINALPGETTVEASSLSHTLDGVARGDRDSLDQLLPFVYQELRRLAERYLQGERSGHTLQPTALTHEAYLRLAGQRDAQW